jgi:hypothetical protein
MGRHGGSKDEEVLDLHIEAAVVFTMWVDEVGM